MTALTLLYKYKRDTPHELHLLALEVLIVGHVTLRQLDHGIVHLLAVKLAPAPVHGRKV